MSNNRKNYFLWLDLETTGLDTATTTVLEIATVLYDPAANTVLGATRHFINPPSVLSFDRTAYLMHAKSALHNDYAEGHHVSAEHASRAIRKLIEQHAEPGDTVHLAGSGVAEFDRRIVERVFPIVDELLHWRSIDIGIFRRAWRMMTGATGDPDHPAFRRTGHRAQTDAYQALEQYQWFRSAVRGDPVL